MEPFWPVICCVLAVLMVLLIKSRSPGIKEHYHEKLYPRTGAENLSSIPDIPLLSVYEAALLIRDIHRLVLLLVTSLAQKGVLVQKNRESLAFEKREHSHLHLDEEEAGFIAVLGEGGRIDHERFRVFLQVLADRLAKKIWLCDKVLVRHFLEDKVELSVEMASAMTPTDRLWLILQGVPGADREHAIVPAAVDEDSELLSALVFSEFALSFLFPPDILECAITAVRSCHD